jgi:hypothetical protein
MARPFSKRDINIRPSEKYLQSFIDEFIKQNGGKKWMDVNMPQRSRFIRTVIPRIKKFLKDSKGLIRRQELAKMLGVSNDYLRAISKSQGDKGGPNVRYKIFQDIIGDVKKIYRPVSGANEGFYKKPTVAQIKAFKKNIRSSTILPVMQERINAFVNNKKFMNMLKNDNLTDPNFLDKTKKLFPKLDLTDQKLADGVLYIARGSKGDEFIGTTIKKNLPLHKRLIKQFEESKWGNPFHAAAYKFARTEIDQQLGTKEGTFREYQKKLSDAFKNAGFKNLKNYEVDEIVGASIGGKQQFAPYSVFSRFLSETINAGPAAAYQGALSRASTELTGIINQFGPNSNQAINFVKDFNKNKAAAFEAKHGVKAARLDLRMPEQVFGKKRFAELGTIGEQMTDVVKQKGFGFKLPEGSLTQKELLQSVASLKPGTKAFKAVCTITKADGGSVDACVERVAQEPEKFANKFKNLTAESGPLAKIKNASINFLKSPGVKTFGIGAGVGAAIGLVKAFRNDDPTTYLSNEDQQKNMLVDMATQPISLDTERPAILDYQLPALGASLVGSTALAAPSTIKASKSRSLGIERKPPGIAKTGLRVLGRGLGVAASPALLAPFAAGDIASQIAEGDSPADIATNPFNYLYPAFADQTPKLTRGLSPTLRKVARLGLSRAALTGLSRLGIGGLGASLAIQGLGLLDD